MRFHPFPFRTRQLSSFASKILGWRRPGKIDRCRHCIYSSIAQSVEHLTVNQGVTGSSPVGGAKTKSRCVLHRLFSYPCRNGEIFCFVLQEMSRAGRMRRGTFFQQTRRFRELCSRSSTRLFGLMTSGYNKIVMRHDFRLSGPQGVSTAEKVPLWRILLLTNDVSCDMIIRTGASAAKPRKRETADPAVCTACD